MKKMAFYIGISLILLYAVAWAIFTQDVWSAGALIIGVGATLIAAKKAA